MLFPRPASDPIRVGPYTLTECIGQGGMAVVYKAKRQGPGGFEKTVVVKAMLPGLITRQELVDLFRAEARLSAQLNHPNIVQVHDFGVAEGVPFLVMEFLNGRNLTQIRSALAGPRDGRLAIGAALAIARDTCHALGYAHDFLDSEGVKRQIIHRDVSPSNVMLCRDGSVKLLDFGVAKVAGQYDCDVTQSFRGKYAYMAPEQVTRQPIDRRVDVFAAGVVLHEMLTGKRLFAAPSELETLERVAAAQATAPSCDNPEVPRALDAIVKRALSRDPAQRYSSGAEMAEALEELSGLAWSRKKLAGYLQSLFPHAWTITCEICGKQAQPGEPCRECGTRAPNGGAPTTKMPRLPSEPLPLPPPPPPSPLSHTPPNLRVVHTPVPFAPPGPAESLAQFPPPDPGSFEAVALGHDRTPVDGVPRAPQIADGAKTWASPVRPGPRAPLHRSTELEHVEPASVPPPAAPRLFVVPKARSAQDDDSVRMGRPLRAAPAKVAPTSSPSFEPSSSLWPAQGALSPVAPVRHGSGMRPELLPTGLPAELSLPDLPAPDLRPRRGASLFIALLVALALGALAGAIFLPPMLAHRSPVVAAAPSAPAVAAQPVTPTVTDVVKPAPVAVTPSAEPTAARREIESPAPQAAHEVKPQAAHEVKPEAAHEVKPQAARPAPARPAAHRARHRAAAAPRTSIKDGRIVDPFAGM